jgi:nucleoid-associated protein YgaU
MFFKGSRYENVIEEQLEDTAGRLIRYKRVRFIDAVEAQTQYIVNQGDRLDHIAFRFYSDPERFWRICDANEATWPDELVEQPGAKILIPPSGTS